tara:strand:- start:1553 stop:2335 length:783 start_codon:yes stop_codon:yes gene_type:complete
MSIAPIPRPDLIDPITGMRRNPGFGLNLPFTRTPEEQMMEGYERKKKQEEAIKQKVGEFTGAMRNTGLTRFAGNLAGTTAGAVAGTKGGAALGATIGAAAGGPVGAAVGTAIGSAAGQVAGGIAGGALGDRAGQVVGEMGEKRKAGEIARTAFGGGAITGDMEGRRTPTEEVMIGNPMAAPTAADFVKMPQDLQAGYVHMNRFGSPLPIHGLATPGRTTMAQDMQDGNLVMQHRMLVSNRDPMGMSRVPFGGDVYSGDFS